MPFKAFFHRHIFVSYIRILVIRDWVSKLQTSEIKTLQSKVYEVMVGVNKTKGQANTAKHDIWQEGEKSQDKSRNRLAL